MNEDGNIPLENSKEEIPNSNEEEANKNISQPQTENSKLKIWKKMIYRN